MLVGAVCALAMCTGLHLACLRGCHGQASVAQESSSAASKQLLKVPEVLPCRAWLTGRLQVLHAWQAQTIEQNLASAELLAGLFPGKTGMQQLAHGHPIMAAYQASAGAACMAGSDHAAGPVPVQGPPARRQAPQMAAVRYVPQHLLQQRLPGLVCCQQWAQRKSAGLAEGWLRWHSYSVGFCPSFPLQQTVDILS